jgi:hypothetical protein
MSVDLRVCFYSVSIACLFLAACSGGGSGVGPPLAAAPTAAPSATGTVASPATAVTAPATYAALFAAVNAKEAQFDASVAAACPTMTKSAKIYVELLPANGNYTYGLLAGASAATIASKAAAAVALARDYQKSFGIAGVTLAVDYPLLVQNSANLPNSSMTTANYGRYLSYYRQVVSGLRAAKLGVDVETNVEFPAYAANGFSYAGLTVSQLAAGVAEDANNVIAYLKPDHVNLASEPLTIATNTGLGTAIDTPAAYGGFLSSVRSKVPSVPGTLVGAGSDDWQSNAFYTAVEAVPLDYYDDHFYPPDYLQAGLAQLEQLHTTGKPLVVTEAWLDKEDAAVDGTPGPLDPMTVQVRDGYSFWGPTDAAYIASMMRLASCEGVSEVSFFYVDNLYAYVPWTTATANLTYAQYSQISSAALTAAIAAGTVSVSGQAVATYDGAAPSPLSPSVSSPARP